MIDCKAINVPKTTLSLISDHPCLFSWKKSIALLGSLKPLSSEFSCETKSHGPPCLILSLARDLELVY